MKHACRLIVLPGLLLSMRSMAAEPLVLVADGRSDYRIVIAGHASSSTRYAAEELRRFLKESSGAELPIVTDTTPAIDREILVGGSSRMRELAIEIDFTALGDEGYITRTIGPRLAIVGGTVRGDLYGVYGFLEKHVGCRWFTPAVSRIPRIARIAVGPLDETRVPALEYREVMLFDCWDADWMARNRVNTTQLLDERRGGSVRFVPGYYVHTFKKLVPPEKYFDAHPEYFAEVNGKRIRDNSQICPTDDDVARIVTEEVRQAFRAHPECRVISVSQNDANDNYCRCPRCTALDGREGTHAAQVLTLVNRVAEAIEAEFPDRVIETLAYEWSLAPPKTIKPRDNVIVRLSTIRCSFSKPLEAQSFHRDLERWASICRRIWIWDYTTYFSYYLLPWPNYRVLDDNILYFVKNRVRGVVEQNNWQSRGGEMAGLKGYLLARFLWDPEYDRDRALDEFLEGVYGNAAPHIRAYLDLLADKVADDCIPLRIYGSRTPPYLTLEILQQADALWEKASAVVADQPELIERVRTARLSVDYAIIEHYRWKPEGMVTYKGDPRHGKVTGIDRGYRARIERFLKFSQAAGITHIREGEADYDDYVTWLRSLMPGNGEE